ncbi:hypothetical protein BN874_1760005 [Candidatus Contendobacter odensis Run_B_J11]|uniref:Uncharacterized protein n=1 Tax=Candidatus Contendobacter odensis Run_B_J11 TaxID=1400861 RepID=A0A7U7GB94_9GAMM|nr:hypothetical protein BN874_1760005 [Candidatus Contendobacter odensis Run_B_J11]
MQLSLKPAHAAREVQIADEGVKLKSGQNQRSQGDAAFADQSSHRLSICRPGDIPAAPPPAPSA